MAGTGDTGRRLAAGGRRAGDDQRLEEAVKGLV